MQGGDKDFFKFKLGSGQVIDFVDQFKLVYVSLELEVMDTPIIFWHFQYPTKSTAPTR